MTVAVAPHAELVIGATDEDNEVYRKNRRRYEKNRKEPRYCACGTKMNYMAGRATKCIRCQDKRDYAQRCADIREIYRVN